MAGKRKKGSSEGISDGGRDEDGGVAHGTSSDHKEKRGKEQLLPSMIKNKDKRLEVHAKLKHQKKLEKRKNAKVRDAAQKRALELASPKKIPRTIENTRVFDDAVCKPDDDERGPAFISDLLSVIPNVHYYKRGTYDLKKNPGNPASHKPELVLNNFTTLLGH